MKSILHVLFLSVLSTLLAGCGPAAIPPATTATGTNAYTIDDVALWVKADYHTRSPETPPYITNQPPIVAAAQLHLLFTCQGFPIDVRKTDYRYANLSNAQWLILRKQSPAKFPVLWSATANASAQRLVVTIDFDTDLFWPAQMPENSFTNELARMEKAIRAGTGRGDFSLLEKVRD